MKKISCNNNVNTEKQRGKFGYIKKKKKKKIKPDSKQWGSIKLECWKCKEMRLDFIWDLLEILKIVVNITSFMKPCHWWQIWGKKPSTSLKIFLAYHQAT